MPALPGSHWDPGNLPGGTNFGSYPSLQVPQQGKGASLAGPGICWGGVGNLNVPEAKSHFCATVRHHAGRRGTQEGNGGIQAGNGAPRQGMGAPSSKFLGVRSQPSPYPCSGHGDEASGRNILLSLAVLELVCAHPQFPLPEVFGQNKRSWGKMELQPFGGGTKPGPAGQCSLRIPKFPPSPSERSGTLGLQTSKGQFNGLCPGYLQLPTAPKALSP